MDKPYKLTAELSKDVAAILKKEKERTGASFRFIIENAVRKTLGKKAS